MLRYRARFELKNRALGFTVAELLIALGILGIIAAFTIPKVILTQQNQQKNAAAKETASMVAAAYQNYIVQNGQPPSTFTMASLIPYINYVKLDTASSLDDHPLFNYNFVCGTNATCLKLHNGGTLFWQSGTTITFGGTTRNNALYFLFDPDGVLGTSGTSDGPSKSVCFFLYYSGFITSRPYIASPSVSSDGSRSAIANTDPSWFSW